MSHPEPLRTEDHAAAKRELLTFRLGEEEYGIDILQVQEIRRYESVTRIANAPDFVKGVINMRGTIVPILDLRIKFRFPDVVYDDFTVVVILNVDDRVIGIVVDAVSDVIALAADEVRDAPEFGAQLDTDYLEGLASIGERMLIIVDIEALVRAPELGLVDAESAA
ncbi:MAG: chemotaxis protein CheW [Gammaproteobacteria bacterium]|nr:MAG: chemotaxis protein CheW [Gammaproteobacteria bacterium]